MSDPRPIFRKKRSTIFGQLFVGLWIFAAIALGLYLLAWRQAPERIEYGASFSTFFAGELGIDWKAAYVAALDDLKIRKLRLAAYWPEVEPQKGAYDFSKLDFEVSEASKRNATIILAIGRRLPRWPECHVPEWAAQESWDEQKDDIKIYLTKVTDRYKGSDAIQYWQVENEPYLSLFAHEQCGDLDEDFLKEEVALVKELDPTRQVLVTDSGNLGLWYKPYSLGDLFGTSLYIYFWNPDVGPFKTKLPAAFYRMKANAMKLFGDKPVMLIELSAEPWLVEPVTQVSIQTQIERMDIAKFKEIILYASRTRLNPQYLWGVEWWYYMKAHGHPEFWEYAKELFNKSK